MTYQPRVASTRDPSIHLWTVEEYRQLVKARLVEAYASSELVLGQIIYSSAPLRGPYTGSIQRLCAVLQRCVGPRARVKSHPPMVLGHNSELRPDIAILRGDAARYRYHPPTSDDVVLLLEVADKWLAVDAVLKAQVYAEAGIQDYWVLDIRRAQLHVFRAPMGNRYTQHQVLSTGQSVRMLLFEDVIATLQHAVPFHFLTRQSRRRSRHAGTSTRLPLMVTRHRGVVAAEVTAAEVVTPTRSVVERPIPDLPAAGVAVPGVAVPGVAVPEVTVPEVAVSGVADMRPDWMTAKTSSIMVQAKEGPSAAEQSFSGYVSANGLSANSMPIDYVPVEPQSVPAPRFLQPAASNDSAAALPAEPYVGSAAKGLEPVVS